MGAFQILEQELILVCTECPDDKANWLECNITKEELTLLKANSLNAFDVFNDGRQVY